MFIIISLLFLVPAAYAFPTTIVPNSNSRIVGGSDAPEGAYPFVVSLRSSAGTHFCGGSILNGLHILTAAHCAVGRTVDNTAIVAGTNTLNSGGVTRLPSSFIIHADYDAETIVNDIAMIRLTSAFMLEGNIQSVFLGLVNTGGVAAILVGWGRTTTDGANSNILQHLNTNTITHDQCVQSWGAMLTTSQICAVSVAGQGACLGDSGGPLIQASNNVQIGILSFILAGGCAQGFPDVYVRVSSYVNWIINARS